MDRDVYIWGGGIGATATTFITQAMPYLQFIAVILGIIATGIVIYDKFFKKKKSEDQK
jgi:hypothetical protein